MEQYVRTVEVDGRAIDVAAFWDEETPEGQVEGYDLFEEGSCITLGEPIYEEPTDALVAEMVRIAPPLIPLPDTNLPPYVVLYHVFGGGEDDRFYREDPDPTDEKLSAPAWEAALADYRRRAATGEARLYVEAYATAADYADDNHYSEDCLAAVGDFPR